MAALAVAGAAAGGLAAFGTGPGIAVVPVNSVTDVLDRVEQDDLRARGAEETVDEDDGERGPLSARNRTGADAAAAEPDLEEAAALAQELAEALAGSSDPAARRIADALADEGFVPAEEASADEEPAAARSAARRTGADEDSGTTEDSGADEEPAGRAGAGVRGEEERGEPAIESIASVLERAAPEREGAQG
ncbi:hypothetical protein BJF78_06285 [Pseudonocardia sp. CNS-139]|nr:hypothetical protein BJF78_06285 [Pseudonocardia sp. CNS-139]